MKISNQIIIVSVLILIFIFMKSDYKSMYTKALTYLQSGLGQVVYQNNGAGINKNLVPESTTDGESSTPTVVKATVPGALIVSDSFLSNNTSKINLVSKNVIDITNEYRRNNGNLPALTENSKLDFSAEKKLQDMFVKGYFEHVSPSGVGVADLGKEVGYEYILIGENLALGNFKDDRSLVDAWMASKGHRANILNNRYTEIGVSVGKGNYNGKTVWMGVQHFGLPKSACPSIDEVLRGIIDLDQKKIKEMESDLSTRKAGIDSGAVREGLTTNGQIDAYNSLVNDYNKLILDIKEKINTYNKEVRNFNSCIQGV